MSQGLIIPKQTSQTTRAHLGLVLCILVFLATPAFSFSIFGRRARSALRLNVEDSVVTEISEPVNGNVIEDEGDVQSELVVSDISPLAPPVTFQKFMTMQNKRVPVSIRYSAESGLKPYFLTVAKKIKESHPDVMLDKVILPRETNGEGDNNENPTFEVLVDGKVVVSGSGRSGRKSTSSGVAIFVNSEELEQAIQRARRRRRPATVYGEDGNARLQILKGKADKHSRD